MTLMICAPTRFATGLLKAEVKDPTRLMTSGDVKGDIENYVPDYFPDTNKITYYKTKYNVNEMMDITITITPGDIIMMSGTTYDGEHFSCPVTGSFELRPVAMGWTESVKNSKSEDGIEFVEITEKEKHQRMIKYWDKLKEDRLAKEKKFKENREKEEKED